MTPNYGVRLPHGVHVYRQRITADGSLPTLWPPDAPRDTWWTWRPTPLLIAHCTKCDHEWLWPAPDNDSFCRWCGGSSRLLLP